jgi:hypothetical protein
MFERTFAEGANMRINITIVGGKLIMSNSTCPFLPSTYNRCIQLRFQYLEVTGITQRKFFSGSSNHNSSNKAHKEICREENDRRD